MCLGVRPNYPSPQEIHRTMMSISMTLSGNGLKVRVAGQYSRL
jgi:hypothetical protein